MLMISNLEQVTGKRLRWVAGLGVSRTARSGVNSMHRSNHGTAANLSHLGLPLISNVEQVMGKRLRVSMVTLLPKL